MKHLPQPVHALLAQILRWPSRGLAARGRSSSSARATSRTYGRLRFNVSAERSSAPREPVCRLGSIDHDTIRLNVLTVLLLSLGPVCTGEPPKLPVMAPAFVELRDQFDAPQRLSFPATNVVVLTIADRKGSEQIDGWVTAFKTRYGARIDIRGLADVSAVPGLWRGRVRKKFQETRAYPVMLDWLGASCAQFGFQPGVANVLVIARDGSIRARFSGSALNRSIKEAFAAVDALRDRGPAINPEEEAKASNSLRP